MSIDELIDVVKPPKQPFEAGPIDRWDEFQKKLGVQLPRDYLDIALTYGTGEFRGSGCRVVVYNPFAAVFGNWFEEDVSTWRSLKDGEGDDEVPYAIFPESPGLLPWGRASECGSFWLTEGNPEHWPILVRGEAPEYERFEMPLTSFLAKVFSREIVVKGIWTGTDKEPDKITFKPQEIKVPDRSNLNTVYELYMAHGMKADFWVQREAWKGSGNEVHVKKVNGKKSGQLAGEAPTYGTGPVIVDVYVNGTLHDSDIDLKPGKKADFRKVEPPTWWTQK